MKLILSISLATVTMLTVGCCTAPTPTGSASAPAQEDPICPALREKEALAVKMGSAYLVETFRADLKKYKCAAN